MNTTAAQMRYYDKWEEKYLRSESLKDVDGLTFSDAFSMLKTAIANLCKHQLSKISMQSFPIKMYLKGNNTMIDALYNYRQDDIHSAEFSDEFNALCIPFEESLTEAQLTTFHQLLDCVSETAAAEMRAAYKAGFKDGATMMREVQE